jgi:hypothetical protein
MDAARRSGSRPDLFPASGTHGSSSSARDSCFRRSVDDLRPARAFLVVAALTLTGAATPAAGAPRRAAACVEGTQSADKVGFSVK